MKTEEKLKQIISSVLQKDITVISNGFSPENVKEWDSLQQMNIIVAIEEEFNIRFGEAESILLKSYAELLKAIQQKTA